MSTQPVQGRALPLGLLALGGLAALASGLSASAGAAAPLPPLLLALAALLLFAAWALGTRRPPRR